MPAEFINDRSQLLKLSFSQLENRSNLLKKTHKGHTYVKVGEIKTNSSAWMRVAYVIKGITTLVFACFLLPLLLPSFRSSLSHSWKIAYKGHINISVYLKKALLASSATNESSSKVTILTQEARTLKEQGRYFEAALFYQKSLEVNPKDAPLRVEYAEVLKKQGIGAKNLLRKLYREGLKLAPNNMIILFNHAKFDVADKEAERDYKQAFETNLDNTELRIAYAKLLIKRYEDSKSVLLDDGDSLKDEVHNIYKEGLKKQPKHPILLLKYAKFLIKHLNQTQEAEDCYENAQIDSSNIDFHMSYADILGAKNPIKAQIIYQKCLQQYPHHAFLLLKFAEFLEKFCWVASEDIIAYGETALEKSPDSVEVHLRFGDLLSRLDPIKAQAIYQKALAIDPNNAELRIQYVNFIWDSNREEALLILEEGLDLQPCDEILLEDYENKCKQLQKSQMAVERFQRALEVDPDNNKLFFRFIDYFTDYIDESQKLTMFEKFIQKQPENPLILCLYGYFLIEKSRQNSVADENMQNLAFSQLENALKLDPMNITLILIYTQALQELGKYEEAAAQYQKIINLDFFLTNEMRLKYFETLKKLNQESKIEVCYQTILQNHFELSLHEEYIEWLISQDRMQDALNELEKTLNYQMRYDKYMHLLTDILSNRARITREEIDETCENYLLGKIAEQPQNAILKWFLARFLEEKNQFDKAIEQYKEILKLHPHASKIQAKYVELLEKNGNWDDLEAYAESLNQNRAQDARILYLIKDIFKYANEVPRVIRLSERMLPILSDEQLEIYENFLQDDAHDPNALEKFYEFKNKKTELLADTAELS
ncbi:tetratricopeptide repeat protein [Candidatus Protochlamydia amoebophila]|uniref:Tetratricopeptide repeat protein n=1 Tax=Protochlamydia amoebophila (strain UWE25) TaxID=264201 RepID=Q6MEV4_PARUW|nr:tetratricopeptide repeat protein [Candidatus Protochlamydia amoebophila]CAF22895.1 unnamed protein product [Candidatus Protochlamydia amoebophila UWE25]